MVLRVHQASLRRACSAWMAKDVQCRLEGREKECTMQAQGKAERKGGGIRSHKIWLWSAWDPAEMELEDIEDFSS